MSYSKEITAQWAHIDANGHMRNTAFSEFCTHVRFSFFAERGFSMSRLQTEQIGPVILREEIMYLREVRLMERVKVTCELYRANLDFSKFVFIQYVFKENGKRAAKLTIEGIWMDLKYRKPTVPFLDLVEVCEQLPKSKDFEWM